MHFAILKSTHMQQTMLNKASINPQHNMK